MVPKGSSITNSMKTKKGSPRPCPCLIKQWRQKSATLPRSKALEIEDGPLKKRL